VQILVVVASIQMRTLNAEVEEVSVITVFGHGLVGPKKQRNCVKCCGWVFGPNKSARASIGNLVNIPELGQAVVATQMIAPIPMAPLGRVLFSSL